jgi:hypothetical protein
MGDSAIFVAIFFCLFPVLTRNSMELSSVFPRISSHERGSHMAGIAGRGT